MDKDTIKYLLNFLGYLSTLKLKLVSKKFNNIISQDIIYHKKNILINEINNIIKYKLIYHEYFDSEIINMIFEKKIFKDKILIYKYVGCYEDGYSNLYDYIGYSSEYDEKLYKKLIKQFGIEILDNKNNEKIYDINIKNISKLIDNHIFNKNCIIF